MMQRWGIRWNEDVGGMEFPVHDALGEFIGYIWRMPEGEMPKYRYPQGFPKASLLYGLDRLNGRKRITLVEGPLDAVWLQEGGFPGVAILGSLLSKQQLALLVEQGSHEVSLCFDNDTAGKLATEMATKMLRRQGFWVYRIELPAKHKDIQEVPHEQLSAVMERRHVCINGAGLIHPRYRRWLAEACKQEESVWKY